MQDPRTGSVHLRPGYAAAPGRLLEAAVSEFGRCGFARATLRSIAQRAGLAYQLITYHFGSKQELWAAALTHLLDDRLQAIRTASIDPKRDVAEQLRTWLRTSFLFTLEGPEYFRLLFEFPLAAEESYPTAVALKIDEFRRAFRGAAQQMCERCGIEAFSVEEVVLLLDSFALAPITLRYELEQTTWPMVTRAYVDFHVDLLFSVLTQGEGLQRARPKRRAGPGSLRGTASSSQASLRSPSSRASEDSATRARFIESGSTYFSQFGFEGSSVRDIALHCGCSFQLIRHHFGSKEQLWKEVIDSLFERSLLRLRAAMFEGQDVEEQIGDWIRETTYAAVHEPMLQWIVTRESLQNSVRYRQVLKPRLRELTRVVNELYLRAHAVLTPRFNAVELQMIVRCVCAALSLGPQRTMQDTVGASERERAEHYARFLLNLLMYGHGSTPTARQGRAGRRGVRVADSRRRVGARETAAKPRRTPPDQNR